MPLVSKCVTVAFWWKRDTLPLWGQAMRNPAWATKAHRNRAATRIQLCRAAHRRDTRTRLQTGNVRYGQGIRHSRVYVECEERGCEPVIPLRGAKANQPALPLALGGRLFPRIPRHSQRFRDLYRGRAAVERAFGDLKHGYGLAPLRVRGLQRVRLHADLVMLGRLSLALSRVRAIPLAT
jgi:hypothetical protein